MRKNILGVGLILLVAFGVMTVLYEIPQNTDKTYNSTVDMPAPWATDLWTALSFNGQSYQMANQYALRIQANPGDRIVFQTYLDQGNDGIWANVFVEQSDGTPILSYNTSTYYPTYSVVVGTPALPYYADTKVTFLGEYYNYQLELGVAVPYNTQLELTNGSYVWADLGSYQITANVYSQGLNQTYLIIAILFLIVGLITTIVGLVSKPKTFEAPPPP